MNPTILLDTGPLVAFLHRRDKYHGWAVEELNKLTPPLLTCEAVLSESCFLMQTLQGGSNAVMGLVLTGLIHVPFHLSEELKPIKRLMAHYNSVPISLADACLVRMSEQYSNSVLLTLDGHFRIFRRHERQTIPIIRPKDLS